MADLFCIRVETDSEFARILEAGFELLGAPMTSWHDADTGAVRFERFFDSEAEAEAELARLRASVVDWADGQTWTSCIARLPREDWQETWKRFFEPVRVAPHIVVVPSWETFAAEPGDCIIELDPGMSFGTGRHETTCACLRAIEALSQRFPGASFLDAGCGSGILSIAAAKLGFTPVTAVDHDPVAVRIATENCRRNNVADLVRIDRADLKADMSIGRYGIVVANMLASILDSVAETVVAQLTDGPCSRLVLGGMLTGQYNDTRTRYEALGLVEEGHEVDGDWCSICMKPRSA